MPKTSFRKNSDSPIRCVGERITATGVPEFREVAWRACILMEMRPLVAHK
ncbi:hypothetical protein [Bathymodiolus japonicus methanotrophic gill symbiont]|nr:hypothetical protein [Bathymodiolus japonicus methanotrophic gill symbiont]